MIFIMQLRKLRSEKYGCDVRLDLPIRRRHSFDDAWSFDTLLLVSDVLSGQVQSKYYRETFMEIHRRKLRHGTFDVKICWSIIEVSGDTEKWLCRKRDCLYVIQA